MFENSIKVALRIATEITNDGSHMSNYMTLSCPKLSDYNM